MSSAVLAPSAPAFLTRPAWTSSAGDEVADLAAQAGLVLDEPQRLIVDVMFAERGNRWAAREVGLIQPRQSGKTAALEAACLADLYLYGGPDQLVIWTAHLFPTANEAFIDIKALIDASDWLTRRVRRITEAAGNQGIELVDGTRLKFLARSKSGGRGFSGSKVYLDESFALSAAEIGSLMPTLSAQPDPQLIYASSAGRLDSAALRQVRDRGRAGDDPSLAYLEWCADDGDCADPECMHLTGAADCLLDDRSRWRQANPALGSRIEEDFIASERLAMAPAEFARERLGWWEDPPSDAEDDVLAGWSDAVTDRAPTGGLHLGVAVSHDSRHAALVVAGSGVLEVVDYRKGQGTGWVVERVAAVRERQQIASVGLLAGSAAAPLAEQIPDCVAIPSTAERVASLALVQGLGSVWWHRGQDSLDIAVRSARRRLSGEGWLWSSALSAADISPLKAAVVAVHLAGAGDPDYDVLDSIL